jgi:hypothetical protein
MTTTMLSLVRDATDGDAKGPDVMLAPRDEFGKDRSGVRV